MAQEQLTHHLNLTDKAPLSAPDGLKEGRTPFIYGWCQMDASKDGKNIRLGWRETDYMNDAPYAAEARALLEQLGLPFPAPEEIYRGTHHDLLFLNNHGVVARIGPTDVYDLINPGILQPLGWLESKNVTADILDGPKNLPFAVVLYPGIEDFKQYARTPERTVRRIYNLEDLFYQTGQKQLDLRDSNTGYIRILDDDDAEIAVNVLLDSDNKYNNVSSKEIAAKKERILEKAEAFISNKADVLSLMMQETFKKAPQFRYLHRAFETHQPLRRLFWQAFDGMPDPAARAAFWETCARLTNKPAAVTIPLWRITAGENGKKIISRRETVLPHVILYRSWTGHEEDRAVPPVKKPLSPAFK